MRTNAIINLVWNRMLKELSSEETAPIQVEIFFVNQKKMYIGTGISVKKDQWDKQPKIIVNTPLAGKLNKSLQDFISKIRGYELMLQDKNIEMQAEQVHELLDKKKDDNGQDLITFMKAQLKNRKDIEDGTRYLHARTIENLIECKITHFDDLSFENMLKFHQHLEGFLAQPSINKQFSVIKSYLHLAHGMELTTINPFVKFKVKRGTHAIRTRLDDSEIEMLQKAELTGESANIRDYYVFQIFTGLSYKDLRALQRSNIVRQKDGTWIEGLRKKNGEYYTVFLLPEALTILEKYLNKSRETIFEAPDQWKYNRSLKAIAVVANINKNLTAHVGRHTAATWMINHGVRLEIVQAILGHAEIATTQVYAKLVKKTIRDEMVSASLHSKQK